MTTAECIASLINWTTKNFDDLEDIDYWKFVGEKRLKIILQGHTKKSNWKRRAIKKTDDTTFRLFECAQTVFPLGIMFLIVERDNEIIEIKSGRRADLDKVFTKTGYSFGWSK